MPLPAVSEAVDFGSGGEADGRLYGLGTLDPGKVKDDGIANLTQWVNICYTLDCWEAKDADDVQCP